MTPKDSPSGPMTKTSGKRIASLTKSPLLRSGRRGPVVGWVVGAAPVCVLYLLIRIPPLQKKNGHRNAPVKKYDVFPRVLWTYLVTKSGEKRAPLLSTIFCLIILTNIWVIVNNYLPKFLISK